ncbi:hypothetical protein [Parabacteroides sp. AF17-28]|uniref:hypothetical protein n=1 Tax=Parabacteroides sp. AF17-28 TaxID=2292241 RepID=UPI000F004736|nr:hypothetical protein [Parabacteroides sp. AF17-28]RHR60842.1 hypothetical protein DWW90_06330 [Parabacteroides sp. AF17-28]
MTYIELKKQNLIERLNAISDESLLDDIEQLLNERETVLHFSPELKDKIDKALEQMQNGEVYTDKEMKKRFAKWLD